MQVMIHTCTGTFNSHVYLQATCCNIYSLFIKNNNIQQMFIVYSCILLNESYYPFCFVYTYTGQKTSYPHIQLSS